MVLLTPAPGTLGLASPAIGPWFKDPAADPPALTIPLPDADLACPITLPVGLEWWAPAGGIASWLIATPARPRPLAGLRQADGTPAFGNGATVILFSLLPEVAERLAALTAIVPRPEGGALPAANTPARPRLARLALEIAPGALTPAATLNLFGPDFPTDITSNADKAAYLGLTFGATLGNADAPAAILARPGKDDRVIVKNRGGGVLSVKLWAFDTRGRPLDAGAVAEMLGWMAQSAQWQNLHASSDATEQRTAQAAPGRVVHLVSAHEGPVSPEITARLQVSGLTPRGGSAIVYQLDGAPAISLTAAADANTDTAPLARIAPLPLGPYAAVSAATPFAGWTDTGTPHPLPRDFLRVALTDVEAHLTGQTRAGDNTNPQQDPRRRITALQNSAPSVMHLTTDGATAAAMAVLRAGPASLMAPELDTDWGAQTPAPIGAGDLAGFDTIAFTVRAIAGEGTAAGGTVTGQRVAVHFNETLPPGAWVRLWTHGRDTATGRRFRQTGAAALADAQGSALLALPLPDGAAGLADGSVTLSLDMLVVTQGSDRTYTDLRFARPVLVAGARLALPADGSTPAGITLYVPEQATTLSRGAGAMQSGQVVLAISGDLATGAVQMVDPATVLPDDRVADSLPNAATAGDLLITTSPAFGQTPEGSLPQPASPGGPARLHRGRSALSRLDTFGAPSPSQERAEMVAHETATNTGLVGSTPARASLHEATPARLGHPGVTAAEEVHGEGVSLAGPAADALRPLMVERAAADMADFLTRAAVPFTPATAPSGPTVWSAVLETMSANMAGDSILRAMVGLVPTFQPGQSWTALKARINNAMASLGLGTLDALVNTSTFNETALAAAVDRALWKTGSGVTQFAVAAQGAIARAEDFIYLQSPALDTQTAQAGTIDLIGRIVTRMGQRPDLAVVLCVPEGWLPDRTAKLEEIRKAGVKAALRRLTEAGPDRVVLFSPIAGPGRRLHLASTTICIDDAMLISGTAHLWRRGLTFDSAVSVALFDDTLDEGRPLVVNAARRALMEQMLGLRAGLLPRQAQDCVAALIALNLDGGFGRVQPAAYPVAEDSVTAGDHAVWNPDGTPPADWATLLAALTASAQTEVSNAIR